MAIYRMNDYFVKFLFGSDQNKKLCLSFINAALGNDKYYFTDIVFVNKDEDPKKQKDKPIRLDIKGKLNTGAFIDIEVQVQNYKYMAERSLYYWARMYGQQIVEGEDYVELKPAIEINLLAFNLLPEDGWINSYRVCNVKSHKLLSEHLHIVYIEIKKLLHKGLKDMNPIEQWGAYFSGRFDDETLKEVPILAEALKAEMHFTADEVAFYEYEMRKKEVMDRISFANQARREGKEEGMQIGRAEGEAAGEARGKEIGKEIGEKNRLLQDIRNLMESFNIPAEKAMQALKLSPEEQAELLPLL